MDVAPEGLQVLVHLGGQLAGRGEHEGACPGPGAAVQALQDGEDEGGGLAAAGLSGRQHVAPGEGLGQRRLLDRRGVGKTEVGDPPQQRGVQGEV